MTNISISIKTAAATITITADSVSEIYDTFEEVGIDKSHFFAHFYHTRTGEWLRIEDMDEAYKINAIIAKLSDEVRALAHIDKLNILYSFNHILKRTHQRFKYDEEHQQVCLEVRGLIDSLLKSTEIY